MIASREYVKDLLGKVLNKKMNGVGTVLQTVTTSKACAKNSQTTLGTLTLTEGVWVLNGAFTWEGTSLRYVYYVNTSYISAYDSAGWVFATGSDIVTVPAGTTATVKTSVWPSDKAITVTRDTFKAVKVANV